MALNRYDPFLTGFDDFFTPTPFVRNVAPPRPVFDLMPLFEDLHRGPDSVVRRTSPGFEINEDDKNFQIAMDLPGVKASDMEVELLNNGRVLHIHGGRKVQKENSVIETKFEKSFTIGEHVDTTKLTANLADGVLVVTAPKVEPTKPETTKIAITEESHPMVEAPKDAEMKE